jgi:hypothetical protein
MRPCLSSSLDLEHKERISSPFHAKGLNGNLNLCRCRFKAEKGDRRSLISLYESSTQHVVTCIALLRKLYREFGERILINACTQKPVIRTSRTCHRGLIRGLREVSVPRVMSLVPARVTHRYFYLLSMEHEVMPDHARSLYQVWNKFNSMFKYQVLTSRCQ